MYVCMYVYFAYSQTGFLPEKTVKEIFLELIGVVFCRSPFSERFSEPTICQLVLACQRPHLNLAGLVPYFPNYAS